MKLDLYRLTLWWNPLFFPTRNRMGNGTGRANKSNYGITKEQNLWGFVVYRVIIRRQFKRKAGSCRHCAGCVSATLATEGLLCHQTVVRGEGNWLHHLHWSGMNLVNFSSVLRLCMDTEADNLERLLMGELPPTPANYLMWSCPSLYYPSVPTSDGYFQQDNTPYHKAQIL